MDQVGGKPTLDESPAAPGAASKIVPAKKKMPPESKESIRTRDLIILSFWSIVLFLGLPVWWWTTSIHRARLPLKEMLAWADGEACNPVFPLQIIVDAPSLPYGEAEQLIRSTQHALDDLNEFPPHHLRLRLGSSLPQVKVNATTRGDEVTSAVVTEGDEDDVVLTVRLQPRKGIPLATIELVPYSTILDVFYAANQVPLTSSSSSALANAIAGKLRELFAEEQATIAYILTSNQPAAGPPHSSSSLASAQHSSQSTSASSREQRSGLNRAIPAELTAEVERRMKRSLKYAPTYHITISLFTSNAVPSLWDIEGAVAEYFTPLLESFFISNFTIDTQVQLYASFSPSVQQPQYDEGLKSWTLRTDDLSGFINAAEWPLSPSIGEGPTLNFVLYVPEKAITPLVVKENRATSWLIPQWGGVMILNLQLDDPATSDIPTFLTKEAIQPALSTFSHQLLSLLGAPQRLPSFQLQLRTLTRIQAASLLLSASSTMGSLARLTVALPSIAIPESVATAVDRTLTHLDASCASLRNGRFEDALKHGRIAEAEAEKGFFEKSMVGQVYFPDEHKVAVYLPLLGPIGVPLVMSALKEIRRLLEARRSSQSSAS